MKTQLQLKKASKAPTTGVVSYNSLGVYVQPDMQVPKHAQNILRTIDPLIKQVF